MPKKILLIENDRDIIEVLKNRFLNEGYDFFVAAEKKEVFDKIKEIDPDCILIDLSLPEMLSFEILEEISERLKVKVPIIAISNSGDLEEIEEAKKLGVKDFVVKAVFDPQEIIDKIEEQASNN